MLKYQYVIPLSLPSTLKVEKFAISGIFGTTIDKASLTKLLRSVSDTTEFSVESIFMGDLTVDLGILEK